MKSKKMLTGLLGLAAILSSCNGGGGETSSASSNSGTSSSSTTKVTLNMSVYYDDEARHMKYITGSGALANGNDAYTSSANGKSYSNGDWKPVWSQLMRDLNFNINDVSPSGKVTIKAQFNTLAGSGFKSGDTEVDIAQGNSDQIMTEGTSKGTILNLADYLDKMPNFNKFLESNPSVKATISDASGKIFYAPYFDGYDELERMLMLREDWVTKLLDSDSITVDTEDSANKLASISYQPAYPSGISTTIKVLSSDSDTTTEDFTKDTTKVTNVITQMNIIGKDNLTAQKALDTLRKYIDDAYGSKYTKRSQLFLGGKAAYDVDELIALFRVVKLCGHTLTGTSEPIVPFFPRAQTSDRTWDYYRFLQFFGVRGVESRNQWLYVGSDGNLKDVRGTDEFASGIESLHQMYEEGLLLSEFTTAKVYDSTDYRSSLVGKTYEAAVTTDHNGAIGFATYDYNQTTTAFNSVSDTNLVSVLPAVADFDDGIDDNYIHYTESVRSVKTQGWFITQKTANDEAKLTKALELFDYLYSDKGNQLMSYGPDDYLAKDDNGNIKTMSYLGKEVPVLSDETKQEIKDLAGGNYTNYYRYYLGATLPVGYIKEQGMEYQTVLTSAQPSLSMLNNAWQSNVLQHPDHKVHDDNHLLEIVPTTLPFTDSQNNIISTQYTDLSKAFTSDKTAVQTISKVVIGGWGSYDNYDFSTKEKYLVTVNNTFKLTTFVEQYNIAYAVFKKNL